MIKKDIQGQEFFVCEHDGTIVDRVDMHLCPHALIGTCRSATCLGVTVNLDLYGNCEGCGSSDIPDRRARYTHKEVVSSYLINELGGIEPRPTPSAHSGRVRGGLSSVLRDIASVFGKRRVNA